MATDEIDVDELIRQQRRARLRTLAIVAAVVVVGIIALVPSSGGAARALEESGFTDVQVQRDGVFGFEFTAHRGEAECTGALTLTPGNKSQSSVCKTAGGGLDLSSD